MNRLILTAALVSSCFLSHAQSKKIDLQKINTLSEAEAFVKANPNTEAKLFSMISSKDNGELIMPLYQKKPRFTFRIDNYTYRILQVDSALSFRVSYIYLDGKKLSKKEIDSVRNIIMTRYKRGFSFAELASVYSMDGNGSGDTGWFTENQMAKTFETAVRSHKKGEIFTIDTPEENWYHVVLKTYEDNFIKELTILKVKD